MPGHTVQAGPPIATGSGGYPAAATCRARSRPWWPQGQGCGAFLSPGAEIATRLRNANAWLDIRFRDATAASQFSSRIRIQAEMQTPGQPKVQPPSAHARTRAPTSISSGAALRANPSARAKPTLVVSLIAWIMRRQFSSGRSSSRIRISGNGFSAGSSVSDFTSTTPSKPPPSGGLIRVVHATMMVSAAKIIETDTNRNRLTGW